MFFMSYTVIIISVWSFFIMIKSKAWNWKVISENQKEQWKNKKQLSLPYPYKKIIYIINTFLLNLDV